ncbi:uncharacterized protein LOC128966060 [Oppia nitens]|uniref:uncharacterized protein LOC128966060 n=1 Tax=Oppia nitens TaxID=1686743 RepID=UPI0023DA20BB|nr:uncharacterized protein LOC128966060 [Oppia nitens]
MSSRSTSYFRDVGPVLQVVRNFLRGRSWNEQLRKPENLSIRPYPKPELPDGPSDKTHLNHYYTRNGRGLVLPAQTLADGGQLKQLTAAAAADSTKVAAKATGGVPKPGHTYRWD